MGNAAVFLKEYIPWGGDFFALVCFRLGFPESPDPAVGSNRLQSAGLSREGPVGRFALGQGLWSHSDLSL